LERLFDFPSAWRSAQAWRERALTLRRQGKRIRAYAFFRKMFDERAARFPP
jgi:hypothetical protein